MSEKVTIMLVDDSAVIRRVLANMLESVPEIEVVASVPNGQMGVDMAGQKKPDMVVLDVEMPVMDGLTALPRILEASPQSKVVMFSTLTAKGADTTLRALALGAIECLVKPSAQINASDADQFKDKLIRLIRTLYAPKFSAARAKLSSVAPRSSSSSATSPAPARDEAQPKSLLSAPGPLQLTSDVYAGKIDLLAIGSSTGGPNALFEVCSHLKDLPVPIVITQHMPATFTQMLAQHLQEKTGIPACEGQNGMVLENGHIYVAPGGFHMLFKREGTKTLIQLDDGPQINFCKPAVDPMLESAVKIYDSRILTAILTGMGSDGLNGCRALHQRRGVIVAQDEATSTVWGMPRAVALDGICHKVLPLAEIGSWLRTRVTKG